MLTQRRKWKVCRQHDSMECGAACLQMICLHYGKVFSLQKLSELCHVTNSGVSMLDMSKAAKSLGINTITGKISVEQLQDDLCPCILHWNHNHFVVLYQVRQNDRYEIADPGMGRITCNKKNLHDHWAFLREEGKEQGIAMFLEPQAEFYDHKSEKTRNKYHLRSLSNHLKKFKKELFSVFIALLIGSLLQLSIPFLTQAIVDVGIEQRDIHIVWLILLGQMVLMLSKSMADYVRRWILLRISLRINLTLVSSFFVKLLSLPMSFFESKHMGDLLQRMGDHSRINNFLTQQALGALFSVFSFVVFGFILFQYDWLIFIILMIGSIVYACWMILFLNQRSILDYDYFEKQAVNNNKTYQFLTYMQEIKLQDCEGRRRKEWEHVQQNLYDVQARSLRLQQKQEVGGIFINETKNIIITAMSASAVIHGDLTLGMMLAVQYMIGQLNSPMEQLMGLFYNLQDLFISMDRIQEIHQQKGEDYNRTINNIDLNSSNDIKICNLVFKYNPNDEQPTINNINLIIPQGKITAIVGASGSGKTTLLKLLLGFYPYQDGDIFVGSQKFSTINMKWWRKNCGVVMQEGVLFSESIERNIAVDDGEVNHIRLLDAAHQACIDEFIESLPLKYNTIIGQEGMGLSQGQKQRILIARAIYRNPKLIMLDEATNALDSTTESIIIDNLNRFFVDRTVVVIAHRLSTVRNADQIIVMQNGKIVETGKHQELLNKKGEYYRLIHNQL